MNVGFLQDVNANLEIDGYNICTIFMTFQHENIYILFLIIFDLIFINFSQSKLLGGVTLKCIG